MGEPPQNAHLAELLAAGSALSDAVRTMRDDDRYLNQLLIAVGLAEPDPNDKAFPFLEEFMDLHRRKKAEEKTRKQKD